MAKEKSSLKRLVARKDQYKEVEVIASNSIQPLLDEALGLVGSEIVRLKYKAKKDSTGLNGNEARMLQGYIKSLVDLSKEHRERSDEQDLANLSDEELLNLVESLKQKRSKNEQQGTN